MPGPLVETPRQRPLVAAARIRVGGIVQGVGFRPFIFRLARQYGLAGTVSNTTAGVAIEVEGAADQVAGFYEDIAARHPPQAHILSRDIRYVRPQGRTSFEIRPSKIERSLLVPISPDLGICEDCLGELFNPNDRRYRYPFINCTNCGPRFTIVRDIPYDRDKTTMAGFEMCEACRAEYEEPSNRRFHAQPNACPACGPRVKLLGADGTPVAGGDPVLGAQHLLAQGKVVAVKGLGGYHLACDARNPDAVARLRARKYREDKPFAVMVRDVQTALALCRLNDQELSLLSSVQRPIVLARKKGGDQLAACVAPRGNRHLGIMLPYTPLHHLLFSEGLDALVMTSGNLSDEPIAYQDDEAITRLGRIADAFLVHDRPIFVRADDSVTRVVDGGELLVRRARGYAPMPLHLARPFTRRILACGAEFKNTFCLTRDHDAFLSHHIGDLDNLETLTSFERGIEHFKKLFHLDPELVAYDLHPRYLSTQYALGPSGLSKVGVQHHHAHIASCLADNGQTKRVIGVAFDGTGYGSDGTIWGGEFLVADLQGFQRAAHLAYVPLPGGEGAIREAWRMAASYLQRVYGPDMWGLGVGMEGRLDRSRWAILGKAADAGINSPLTSSAGRLFDAVSAMLGVCSRNNYEGQAAVELEGIADEDASEAYPFKIESGKSPMTICVDETIRAIVGDLQQNESVAAIAGRFHETCAQIILLVCQLIREQTGLGDVALSGGVFQNVLLLGRAKRLLAEAGFEVLTHHRVPPNDGGIALGQAVIADAQCAAEGTQDSARRRCLVCSGFGDRIAPC